MRPCLWPRMGSSVGYGSKFISERKARLLEWKDF